MIISLTQVQTADALAAISIRSLGVPLALKSLILALTAL